MSQSVLRTIGAMSIPTSLKLFRVVDRADWTPEARAFEAFVAQEEEQRKPAEEVFRENVKTWNERQTEGIHRPHMMYHEMEVDQGWVTFELRVDGIDYARRVSCLSIRDVIGGAKTIWTIIKEWADGVVSGRYVR